MTALFVVPLLASCGGSVNTSPMVIVDPNGLTLPDCQDGQLVGINPDKTLTCVSALSGMLTPPTCLPGTQALTSLKDSVTGNNVLSCINKGNGANDVTTTTRINNAKTTVTNLQTMVNTITTGGGNRGHYIGPSNAAAPNGSLVNGALKGLAAANKTCETDYPGMTNAHLCTPFEIYESVSTGSPLLDGTVNVGPLMVYMEAWVPPFAAGGTEPNAGESENCGAGTYPTADRKWHNTFFTFAAPSGSTTRVAQFNASIGCSASAKLACCK